jgi:hypothetical protein
MLWKASAVLGLVAALAGCVFCVTALWGADTDYPEALPMAMATLIVMAGLVLIFWREMVIWGHFAWVWGLAWLWPLYAGLLLMLAPPANYIVLELLDSLSQGSMTRS